MHNNQSNKFVCASCLEDEVLQNFVRQSGGVCRCDYCGTTLTIASVALVSSVTAFMRHAILKEWCPLEESDSYSSEAEGYAAKPIENYELFDEIGFDVANEASRAGSGVEKTGTCFPQANGVWIVGEASHIS
jgi:ribosomal protein L37AE/L43A